MSGHMEQVEEVVDRKAMQTHLQNDVNGFKG
jgi:hypothetical protein